MNEYLPFHLVGPLLASSELISGESPGQTSSCFNTYMLYCADTYSGDEDNPYVTQDGNVTLERPFSDMYKTNETGTFY